MTDTPTGEFHGGKRPTRVLPGRRAHAAATLSERHLSPALRSLPASALTLAPLTGVRARIYGRLWSTIADGRIKTGAQLNESNLQGVFKVSRTLIRSTLERLAAEGCVTAIPNKSIRVAEPSSGEAFAVFDALGIVMRGIVRALADPARILTPDQRRLLDIHLEAQRQADAAGDPLTAHLLGIEFLILLAVLHGVTLLTDLVARIVVLETLSLKLYGTFPPPLWYVAFQQGLIDAILAHEQDEAVAEFDARLGHIRATLRVGPVQDYEEDDITRLLGDA